MAANAQLITEPQACTQARAQAQVLGFEEYVRSRQDALLRSARRLVPDPIDAQDLVQTALARTFPR